MDAIDHQQFLTRSVCIVGDDVHAHSTLKCSTKDIDKKQGMYKRKDSRKAKEYKNYFQDNYCKKNELKNL